MIVDGKRVARVFPRKTKATPDDEWAFVGSLPRSILRNGGIDEVHISVTWTYDIPRAEKLVKSWEKLGVPVKIGGPAFGDRNGDFTPGMYVKKGYVFTSRGCNNKCWFCSVWRDCDGLRELEVKNGWIVCDDNICATSEQHFRKVCDMLKRQPERPRFVGGIEAKILTPWQAEMLREAKTKALYCAYDTEDDYAPLVDAGRLLRSVGFTAASHVLSCYVLVGYKGDTFSKAEDRLIKTIKAGFMPYAMLYRDKQGAVDKEWRSFQREWCRPIIASTKFRQHYKEET